MKRYDLELTATGPVMEERKEGAFIPCSEVVLLKHHINQYLEERSSTGMAISNAILSGIVPEQHPLRSRLELLASHHKREQALVDLVHRMVTMMDMAGEETEKDSLNPLRAWVYDAGTLLAGQLPPPQSNRGITLMMSELHDIIVGLDIPGGAQNGAEVWGQVIAARDRVQVCLSSGCPDTEWTDATSSPTAEDYRELQAQHDQVQSRLKGALDTLQLTLPYVEHAIEYAPSQQISEGHTNFAAHIEAALAGKLPDHTEQSDGWQLVPLEPTRGRTISEGQEFELTTVLQSIANGFSDDPAHDAAALLKRIAVDVPWTGDSFQIPPRQGGEPCDFASPSSSPD